MKKLAIKILSLIVAFTAVFAFANLNASPVKADDKANGFWMENGARVRFVGADEDLTGIRFEANIAQSLFNSLAEENEGKILYVGIEIAPSMMENPVDICYSARKLGADEANYTNGAGDGIISAITFANEEPTTAYNFHASLTYRVADLISALANNPSFNPYYVEGNIDANIASFENAGLVDAYLLQAICMDVVAKAYYRLDDGAKVYVSNENVQTRSMIYVANSANVAGEVGALTPEFVAKYLSTATEVENVYIQQDGEVVGYTPATLEGSTFYVHDGVTAHQVEVSLDNGKFMINDDLSKYYDLKDETCLIMMSDDVIATANGNIVNKKITNLYGEFVTLAIDETNDLKIFDSKLLNTGSDPVYGRYGWNTTADIRYHYVYFPNEGEQGYGNVASGETWESGIAKNRYVLHQETEDVEHLNEYFYYANYVSSGKTYVPEAISTALNTQDDAETTDVNERRVAIEAITYTTQTNDYSLLAGKVRYARIDFAVSKWNVNDGYYVLTKDVDAAGLAFIQDGYLEGYALGKYSEYGSEFTWDSADESANILDLPKGIKHDQNHVYFGAYRAKYRVAQNVDAYYNYTNYLVGLTGHFDGKGYAIKNFVSREAQRQWTQTYMSEANPMSGFFGMLSDNAIVENVSFIDVDTTAAGALGALYSSGNTQIKNVFIKVKDGVVNPKGVLAETFLRSKAYKVTIENVVIDATGVTFDTTAKTQASLFINETGDGYRNTFNLVSLLNSASQYAFKDANVNNVAIITNGNMPFAFYKSGETVYEAYASNKAGEEDLVNIIVDGKAYVTFSQDKESKGFTQYDSVEAFNNAETGVNKDAFNNEYWANINDKLYFESYFAENHFAVVGENDEALDLSETFAFESFDQTLTIKLKDTSTNVIFTDEQVELEDASGYFKYENGVISFNAESINMSALGTHNLALKLKGTSLSKEFSISFAKDPITLFDGSDNELSNVTFNNATDTKKIVVKDFANKQVNVTMQDNNNFFTYENGVLALKENVYGFDKFGEEYEVTFKFYQAEKTYTTDLTISFATDNVINSQVVYDTNPVLSGTNTNRYFYDGQGYNAKEFYLENADGSLVKLGEYNEDGSVFTNYVDRASFLMVDVGSGVNGSRYTTGTLVNYYSFKVGETTYKVYYNNPSDKWLGLTMYAVGADDSVVKMNNALPVTDAINESKDLEIVNGFHLSNNAPSRTRRMNATGYTVATTGSVTRGVFILTNDIDAKTGWTYNNPSGHIKDSFAFSPIFAGVFDGNGYEIANLNLDGFLWNNTASGHAYEPGGGLFGVLTKDTAILNLALTNVSANNGSVFSGSIFDYVALLSYTSQMSDAAFYPSRDILNSGTLSKAYPSVLSNPLYRNIYVEIKPSTHNFRGVFNASVYANNNNRNAHRPLVRAHNVVIKYIPTNYGLAGENWAQSYIASTSHKGYDTANISAEYRDNQFKYNGNYQKASGSYNYINYKSPIGILVGYIEDTTTKNYGWYVVGGGVTPVAKLASTNTIEKPELIGVDITKDIHHESSIYVISPLALATGVNRGYNALTYEDNILCGDSTTDVAISENGDKVPFTMLQDGTDDLTGKLYYLDSTDPESPAYVLASGVTSTDFFNTYMYGKINKFMSYRGNAEYTVLSRFNTVESFAQYINGAGASLKSKFNNSYWTLTEVEIEGTTYSYPSFVNKA